MSEAAFQRVTEAQSALIAALDSGELYALEAANADFAAALDDARGSGAWHDRPGFREELKRALAMAQAAGARLNLLADRNRRRLEQVAVLTGNPRPHAYRRNGRLG